MLIILLLISLILSIALFFSLKLNIKNVEKLDKIYLNVEESLNTLDSCYLRASRRANLDVFSNDPVIMEHIKDLRMCREIILQVANLLTEQFKDVNEG